MSEYQLNTTLADNVQNVKLQIDINYRIQFKKGVVTKEILKKKCQTASNYWETIEISDVDELKRLIGQGYTVRPCVKSGLTDDSIVGSTFLFLDFDDSTVQETLNVPWSDYAAFYYYSPSYIKGENEKHRLVFQLSRTLNSDEYERFYTAFRMFYTKSDTLSRGSIFFGAVDKDEVHHISNETLDVEPYLKSDINFSPSVGMKPGVIDSESSTPGYKDGVMTRVLSWVNKEIWNGICGNDIDKLYCLHRHTFQDMPKGNNLAKWGGHRPEDTSKKTGTGFFVYWDCPDFPPRFDNQGAADINGTFIDYWCHYASKDFGEINWESKDYIKNLQSVVDDIADKFDVKPLSIKTVKKEIDVKKKEKIEEKKELSKNIIKDVVKEYVFEDRNGSGSVYIYYDFTSGVWRVRKDIQSVYRHCLKPALIAAGLPQEEAENLKFINYVINALEKGAIDIDPMNKLDFDDLRDFSKLPLLNGDFDIYTKQFNSSADSKIFNQRRYSYAYKEYDQSRLERFQKWLQWTYKDAETRQVVIDWLALNVMGIAYETEVLVCLWGTPGTGKSIILNLINWIMGENVTVMDAHKLMKDSNFIYQSLDGAMAVTIDEFKINQTGWESIKKFTGSASPVISIEKKNLTPYNSKMRLGITTASQDKFVLPNSDDGGIRRRVVPIHHGEDLKSDEFADMANYLSDKDIYQNIFQWLIQTVDPREAVKRIKAFKKSEKVKENLLNQMIEQDDVLGFMSDCLEFTNNPNDVLSNFDIQSAYKCYLESEKMMHLTDREQAKINMVTKYIREKAKISDNGFNWTLCPDVGQQIKISIDGKRVKGLKGLKLKADFLSNDLPI